MIRVVTNDVKLKSNSALRKPLASAPRGNSACGCQAGRSACGIQAACGSANGAACPGLPGPGAPP